MQVGYSRVLYFWRKVGCPFFRWRKSNKLNVPSIDAVIKILSLKLAILALITLVKLAGIMNLGFGKSANEKQIMFPFSSAAITQDL